MVSHIFLKLPHLCFKFRLVDFKEKKLIIFDFDGTLINSIPDLAIAANKILSNYNLPSLTIEEITPFIGNGAKPLVKRCLEASAKKEVSTKFLEEAFNSYILEYEKITCQETFLYPNVLDTLKYLSQNGYTMVICTNKPFKFVEPILDKLKIKQFFKIWIGEDSLSTKKPSPEPLLFLAKETNIDIEKCVMIGDSKNDILAAQNAKMESIGVSYGYNYNENIADYNPTIVIDGFGKLKELF